MLLSYLFLELGIRSIALYLAIVLRAKPNPRLLSNSVIFWSLSLFELFKIISLISSMSCIGVTFLVLETEVDNKDFINTIPLGVWIYFDLRIREIVDGLTSNSFANSILLIELSWIDSFNKNLLCFWHIKVPTFWTVSFLLFMDLMSHLASKIFSLSLMLPLLSLVKFSNSLSNLNLGKFSSTKLIVRLPSDGIISISACMYCVDVVLRVVFFLYIFAWALNV